LDLYRNEVHFANQIYFSILKSEETFSLHIRKKFVYFYTYKTTELPHYGVPNRKSFLPQMGSKLTATLKQEYLLHRGKFTQRNSFLFCIYLT
jgi:hypothetical protein